MPKARDIIAAIEEYAPLELQEHYDNSGLQVGSPEQEVHGALLCTDISEAVVQEAVDLGLDMVISHHPIIFRGLKKITGATEGERAVILAIQKGVVLYSAHTNLDSAAGGVSERMARKLGLTGECQPLEVSANGNGQQGLGVIVDLQEPVAALDLLARAKEVFETGAVKYAGNASVMVRRLALVGGAGSSYAELAAQKGAQLLITADVKYHEFLDASEHILLADIGHYESEHFTKEIFYEIITKKMPNFVTKFANKEKNKINYL